MIRWPGAGDLRWPGGFELRALRLVDCNSQVGLAAVVRKRGLVFWSWLEMGRGFSKGNFALRCLQSEGFC